MEKKRTIKQLVICASLLCLIWGIYFYVNSMIKLADHRQISLREDNFSWVYQVDSLENKDKEVVLKGFAFKLKNDATAGAFEIVLHDSESGENYFPKMKYMDREDVNDYFLCEYEYLKSGFEATIKESVLKQDKCYEVLLRPTEDSKAFQTGVYIYDGKIAYANPEDFEELDVQGTDLESVVDDGVLRAYKPEAGVYVYQYKNELYWITDSRYEFIDNDSSMEYSLYTTQIFNLPQKRLDKQYSWDNIGFHFSEQELTEDELGEYRVARKAIPVEYSITKIVIGSYVDEWLWKHSFRPYYVFD